MTVDLRPAICDVAISGMAPLVTETKAAMESIASAGPLDYVAHLPTELPTDGNKITPKMLDSKADLQALIDGAEMFRVVDTVEPIQ